MNADWIDMLSALSAEGAEFLLIGAHARAVHGSPRATGDLDLWIRPSVDNAARVWAALHRFGAPLHDLNEGDLHTPGVVFQIGVVPSRIDLLTAISGVEFDEAWAQRVEVTVAGLRIACIGRAAYLKNKRAAGRPKDLADVDELDG